MRLFYRIVIMLVPLMLSMGIVDSVRAGPPAPQTPSTPPLTPTQPGLAPTGTPQLTSPTLDLPPLKAVLIVGPIGGDNSSWTTQEKQNMELAAVELEANGVTVHRFYTPNNNWQQITAAARGAHFLFYRGHGVYWSAMPRPTVGGFALKDRFISSDQIRADLELAPNAIVMLYGCFTAGTSALDDQSIDSAEAQRRVAQYSDPFFDLGVGGYYADWFGDAFQMYVRYLFQGLTLGEAYESFYDFNAASVERTTYPEHAELAMWLDKDFWDGKWQYNNAFIGRPDQTLEDLFSVTPMELSSAAVNRIAEPAFPPQSYQVRVESRTGETFNWTATVAPGGLPWLSVTPQSGRSGEEMTITLAPRGLAPGNYQANLRVLAGSPQGENGDETVAIALRVVDRVRYSYLPMVRRP